MEDRNDLAYWFPRLLASGFRVPRTTIVTTSLPLFSLSDGYAPVGLGAFLDELRAACDAMGYPCFLRTGQTSHKHAWRRTCYLERGDDLASHVAALVEFSEEADFLGLPTGTWAVREFLDLEYRFRAFDGMPAAREFRCFFEGGKPAPICVHPYWPPDSIRNPSVPDWFRRLDEMQRITPADETAIGLAVAVVAPHFDGRWSLDLAYSADGRLYATDMAEMDRSYHWAGCPHDPHPEYHRKREPMPQETMFD